MQNKQQLQRIIQLKKSLDTILEYIHYCQETNEETKLEDKNIQNLRDRIQGSIKREGWRDDYM